MNFLNKTPVYKNIAPAVSLGSIPEEAARSKLMAPAIEKMESSMGALVDGRDAGKYLVNNSSTSQQSKN